MTEESLSSPTPRLLKQKKMKKNKLYKCQYESFLGCFEKREGLSKVPGKKKHFLIFLLDTHAVV